LTYTEFQYCYHEGFIRKLSQVNVLGDYYVAQFYNTLAYIT
jgi:hypothetical protein